MKIKMNFSVFLFALTLTLSAAVTQAQSQTLYPLQIAGDITAYQPADCGNGGSITIAGLTFRIAPGIDAAFGQNNRVIVANGQINSNGFGRSQVHEVVGSRRLLTGYIDEENVIRYVRQFLSSNSFSSVQAVSVGTTTSSLISVTGKLNSVTADAIRINGLTLSLANGITVSATPGSSNVLVFGNLSNGQLTSVGVSNNPYRRSVISGTLNPLSTVPVRYAPENSSGLVAGGGGAYACNLFTGFINFGFTSINFAPDFRLDQITSPRFVGLEVVVDEFGFATTGTRLVSRSESVVCGVVETFVPPPIVNEPTTLSEVAQRGFLFIGGIGMTIGPNEKITGSELVQTGRSYCVYPEYNTYAEAPVNIVPGQLGLTRAFQLVTGSRIVPQ